MSTSHSSIAVPPTADRSQGDVSRPPFFRGACHPPIGRVFTSVPLVEYRVFLFTYCVRSLSKRCVPRHAVKGWGSRGKSTLREIASAVDPTTPPPGTPSSPLLPIHLPFTSGEQQSEHQSAQMVSTTCPLADGEFPNQEQLFKTAQETESIVC